MRRAWLGLPTPWREALRPAVALLRDRGILPARPLSAGSNGSHGVAETPISPKVDSGSEVPYWLREHSPVATLEDIYYCFRLLLGRSPGPNEWPGHSGRVGMNLVDVVRPYLTSLEFANRELFTEPNTEIELGSIEGFDIYFSTRDAGVGAAIRAGSYEPHVTSVFRRIAKPGMGVIDIGANIGYFAMLASSLVGPSGRVFAVEPNSDNVKLMLASRARNGFDHLHVVQAAAGLDFAPLQLNVASSNGFTSRLADRAERILASQTVGTVRLDAVLAAEKEIALIKIDVEGAEYLALKGAARLIEKHQPYIVSEFSPDLLDGISGVSATQYLGFLSATGYTFSAIGLDGAVVPCPNSEAVLAAYRASGLDHIDILARPNGRPVVA